MTIVSDIAPEARAVASAPPKATRPLYTSMRRELWENRSIWVVPAVVAGLVLAGFIIGLGHMSGEVRLDNNPGNVQAVSFAPYGLAWGAIAGAGLIVSAFYCLGALHNERRDRSILFWKSMPVSDLATVAVKAAVPVAVVPVVAFAFIVVTQFVMWLIASAIHASGGDGRFIAMWTQWPLGSMWLMMAWVTLVSSIWYAPVWGYLLMVGVWARRAPFLWAVLPPLGVMVVEGVAFGSGHFGHMIGRRLTPSLDIAFVQLPKPQTMPELSQIDPVGFFGSYETWLGLVFAAAFLAAAVWLRRRKDPS